MDKAQEEVRVFCCLFRMTNEQREQARKLGYRFPPRRMYDPSWADKLYRGLKRHSTVPFHMVCISNYDPELFEEDIMVVPYKRPILFTNCMTEIFRPDLEYSRCVFFGLDAIVIGNMDEILTYPGEFVQMDIPKRKGRIGNAVVNWTPNRHTRALYKGYEDRGWDCMPRFKWRRYPSEEEYWTVGYGGELTTLTRELPGQLLSFKREWRHNRYWNPDSGFHPLDRGMARMIYFSGRPKPHALPWEHGYLLEHWV